MLKPLFQSKLFNMLSLIDQGSTTFAQPLPGTSIVRPLWCPTEEHAT